MRRGSIFEKQSTGVSPVRTERATHGVASSNHGGRVNAMRRPVRSAGAAWLTGSPDVVPVGNVRSAGAALLTGSADVVPVGNVRNAGVALLTGSADVVPVGNVRSAGAALLTGSADVVPVGNVRNAGVALLTGSAGVSPAFSTMAPCFSVLRLPSGCSKRLSVIALALLIAIAAPAACLVLIPNTMLAHARSKPVLSGNWQTDLAEGEQFLKTKEFARAELCFRRACDDVKRIGSADDNALCMLSLARALYMQDLIADTVPLYKKIILILEKAHGKHCAQIITPLVELAGIFEDEGDYVKSAKQYTRAIDITAQVYGTKSLAHGDYQHRLGRVRVDQEMLKDGEECYLSALNVLMHQTLLPSSDIVDECLTDYITLLLKTEADRAKPLRSAVQAELLKDRVGELRKKRGAPQSNWSAQVSAQLADKAGAEASARGGGAATPGNQTDNVPPIVDGTASDTTSTRIIPGKTYSDFAALEKINQQRVAFYERMIASDIDSLGANHPSVARDLGGLASIYIQQRKYDEAKPLLERALVIYRSAYKGDSPPSKQTEFLLQLISEEQTPENITIDTTYVTDLPKIPLEAQKLEVALRLNDLAFMLYCQGKIDTALKVYYWALAATAGSTGETSLLAAGNMTDLSKVLRLRGRASEAQKLEVIAKAIVRRDLIEKRSRLLP